MRPFVFMCSNNGDLNGDFCVCARYSLFHKLYVRMMTVSINNTMLSSNSALNELLRNIPQNFP